MTDDDNADVDIGLLELLGEDGFFRLTEAYAGVRLFVPRNPERSDVPERIGYETAALLSKAYGGNYLRVPLARTLRARRYRAMEMSNRDIAIRLGLTETAVQKIFTREKKAGREMRSKRDPRQLDMFR